MALGTPTTLGATQEASGASSITSASVTPTPGAAVLIFVSNFASGSGPYSLSSTGFTNAPTFTLLTAGTIQGALYYAIWPSNASGTGTFTVGFGSAVDTAILTIVQVTGAGSFGATLASQAASVSTLTSSWSATTTGSDCMVVATSDGNLSASAVTPNTPTNYTDRPNSDASFSNTYATGIGVAYRVNAVESSMTGTTPSTVTQLRNIGIEVLPPPPTSGFLAFM